MRLPAALLSTVALLFALPGQAADLTVTLSEIRASTGIIKLGLVDSTDGWDGKAKPVYTTGAPPSGDTQVFTFKDVAPGRYAVMVTHDENGNGKLDTNMIGMPTEGYGFSNNPNVMRKPTFDEAVFEFGADGASLNIELR